MPPISATAVACASALAIPLAAQSFGWTNLGPSTSPPARMGACSAYDAARQRFVLFGGANSSFAALTDTWEWDGATWAQRNVAVHPATSDAAMAYDPVRQRVVLFDVSGETWEWDGAAWLLRTPANGPSARWGHCMAFDAVAAKVMLFGGNMPSHNETWTWDGTNWQQLSPTTSPVARSNARMVGAGSLHRILMYGGMTIGGTTTWMPETWTWTGTDWQPQLTLPVPTGLPGTPSQTPIGLAFDDTRQRVVLIQGPWLAQSSIWEWNGANWASMPAAPVLGTAVGLCAAFDVARNETLVFTSHMTFPIGSPWYSQTWVMRPVLQAVATSFGLGCGAPALVLAPDPAGRPLLGLTGRATIAQAPTLAAGVALGFSNVQVGPLALPYDLAPIGMPGCFLLQSNDLFGLGATPLSPTTLAFQLAIPNLGDLLGVHAYVQAYALAPGVNPLQLVVSNGLDWRFGNW